MKFRQLHIDRDHYYAIGIDDETGDHVMEVVITWIAWYSRYFRLTADEVARFEADRTSLRQLSMSFASPKAPELYRDRLIYSQKTEENTRSQHGPSA